LPHLRHVPERGPRPTVCDFSWYAERESYNCQHFIPKDNPLIVAMNVRYCTPWPVNAEML